MQRMKLTTGADTESSRFSDLADWGRKEIDRRDRNARADGDPQGIRRRQPLQGRAHHRLAAHDHSDGGADRDAEGPRCRGALGLLQHLLDPGSRGGGDRRRRHARIRRQGRDAGGVLGLHPPHLRLADGGYRT